MAKIIKMKLIMPTRKQKIIGKLINILRNHAILLSFNKKYWNLTESKALQKRKCGPVLITKKVTINSVVLFMSLFKKMKKDREITLIENVK